MCERMLVWLMVAFVAGCKPVTGYDLRPFVAVAGYYALMEPPAPKPGPRACENCNGLGYLTDGTVRTVCPVCKGNKATSGAVQCQSGTCRPVLIGR